MQRIARWGRLKPDAVEEYVRLHREISQELRDVISKAGIRNFSIYIHGLDLFSYLETDDWEAALDHLEKDPVNTEWADLMKTLVDEPIPWPRLEEIFHVD